MKTTSYIRMIISIAWIVLLLPGIVSPVTGQSKKAKKTVEAGSNEAVRDSAAAFLISWIKAWEAKDWVKVMAGIDNDGRHLVTEATGRLYYSVEGLINYKSTGAPIKIEIDSVTVDVTAPAQVFATARYKSFIPFAGPDMKIANLDVFMLEHENGSWLIKTWIPHEYFPVQYDPKIEAVWNYQRETTWRFYDASVNNFNLLLWMLKENKKNGKTPASLGESLGGTFAGNVNPRQGFSGIVASQVRRIQSMFLINLEIPEITNTTARIRFSPNTGFLEGQKEISGQEYLEFFEAFFRSSVRMPGYTCKLTDEGVNWLLTMEYDPGALIIQQIAAALGRGDTLHAEMLKSENLRLQGNTAEASEIQRSLMKRYPHNREVVQNWIIANIQRSPTGEQEMIPQLEKLSGEFPDNAAILFWKIFLEAETGKSEEAFSHLEKLIALEPDSADNWLLKAQLLAGKDRIPEALEAIDKSLSLKSKNPDAIGIKTSMLIKQGKLDEAMETLNKGLEMMPGNPIFVYNKACIFSLKGDKANALSHLKTAVGIMPGLKQQAMQDQDFTNLREDEEFKTLLK